ncbi:extracellular solute-binding protein [Terrarubrum flagellatum]|uniref:extracellular solute-binding protein n=1 Tax=Terrirubrum flagellatum TaxID=2895980 RepID=UPI003144E2A1
MSHFTGQGFSRRAMLRSLGASGAIAATGASLGGARAQSAKKILYWGHTFPSRVRIVNEIMAPGFRKEAGIDVTHEDFETNQNELKIITAWAGGAGGPDLVSVGDSNLPNYVYRKLIAPVDPTAFGFKTQDELVAAYEPGVLDGFVVDGKLYGIPMDLASISMYYRKDFFKEVGLDPDQPPQTWEDVAAAARKLLKTDSNGKVIRAGWSWLARSNSSHFYYWGAMLPQKGVDFISKDGAKNGFNNDGGVAVLDYVSKAFHGSNKFAALGLAPTINPIDDFGAGRAAMINSGLWLQPSLEAAYPKITFKDGVYGIARLPQFAGGQVKTRLNPWVWMVSARSSVQKEAWQFVAYMTAKPENRKVWLQQAQYVQPWKGFDQDPAVQAIPGIKSFLADLSVGVPMPRTARFVELSSIVAKAYDRVTANGEKAEVVVPQFAAEVDRLLEG